MRRDVAGVGKDGGIEMVEDRDPCLQIDEQQIAVVEPVLAVAPKRVMTAEARLEIEGHPFVVCGVGCHQPSVHREHHSRTRHGYEVSRLHFGSAEAERAVILIGVAGPGGSIEPASRRMAMTVAGVDGNRGFPVSEAGLRGQRKDRIAAEHLLRRRIAALEGTCRLAQRRPIEPAKPSADRQPSCWSDGRIGGDVGGLEPIFALVLFERVGAVTEVGDLRQVLPADLCSHRQATLGQLGHFDPCLRHLVGAP